MIEDQSGMFEQADNSADSIEIKSTLTMYAPKTRKTAPCHGVAVILRIPYGCRQIDFYE
ncbi:MAG TPA: hypothetical protein VL002_01290 [Candidimonas sp.]|nr:hypothetical protein [Candidimonas sp.]